MKENLNKPLIPIFFDSVAIIQRFFLGLKNESKKYANLLGYNYQSSEWYKKSYRVFNKEYKKRKINKEMNNKKGNPIINKMISLF